MTYWMSILMGILQGIAEFLPISSSGHLALFQHFFAMENVEESQMFFTVLLHFATLIAVCVYYWQDIIDMIREFFLGIRDLASRGRRGREKLPPARRLVLLIIVATLPLFVVLPIKDLVEGAMSNVTFVSFALLATGFILFFSDRMARGRKTERTATVLDALLVGCAQALGTLPGISRSGITISAGMLRGYDRTFAVRFSFLMSLPAVFGATLLELNRRGPGGDRHQPSARLSGGHAGGRRGGLLRHPPGEPAGGQGKVRRLCLLLLGGGSHLPGRQPGGAVRAPRTKT